MQLFECLFEEDKFQPESSKSGGKNCQMKYREEP